METKPTESRQVTIALNYPVESEGAELKVLHFREPTAEDVIECGYPFELQLGSETDLESRQEARTKFNMAAIASLASRLANVPKSTIKRLSVTDFQQVLTAVAGFFG